MREDDEDSTHRESAGRPAGHLDTPESTASHDDPGDGASGTGSADSMPPDDGRDRWRDLALFVPRLLKLVGRLIKDPDVELLDKVLLGAAAAYVASPIDILPDAVPLLGQIDDIYLIALCLLRLMHRSGEGKLRQHWDGPEDIVQLLHMATDFATRYLPSGLRDRLRGWVESKSSPRA